MAAAKTAGAEVKETGFFNMDHPGSRMDWPLETLQKIFTAKAGDILEPVETASGIQIIRITEKKPAFIPAFDTAKSTVKDKLTAEKTMALAKETSAEIQKTMAAKVSDAASFETTASELGLTTKTTPLFSRGDYIPEIGISDDFASAAFGLNKEKPLSAVVLTTRGPAILYWKALQPVDEKKFEEVKKDFTLALYEEERIAAMNRVIKEIKEKAGLESYLEKVKK